MKLRRYLSYLTFSEKTAFLTGKIFNTVLFRVPKFADLYRQQSLLSIITDQLNYTVQFENDLFILFKNGQKIYLRKNSSDLEVFYQILCCKEYKPAIDLICNQLKLNVDTIIDLGSNIGLSTIYFNEIFPFSRIISVEPDKGNYNILKLNTHQHSNIELLNTAIWSSAIPLIKKSTFRDGRNWSTSYKESNTSKNIDQIEACTIQGIISNNGIDHISFLKIDIEGAENIIFSDRKNVDFLNIVDVLAIEIHDEVSDRNNIHQILRSYDFFILDYNETTLAFKLSLLN